MAFPDGTLLRDVYDRKIMPELSDYGYQWVEAL